MLGQTSTDRRSESETSAWSTKVAGPLFEQQICQQPVAGPWPHSRGGQKRVANDHLMQIGGRKASPLSPGTANGRVSWQYLVASSKGPPLPPDQASREIGRPLAPAFVHSRQVRPLSWYPRFSMGQAGGGIAQDLRGLWSVQQRAFRGSEQGVRRANCGDLVVRRADGASARKPSSLMSPPLRSSDRTGPGVRLRPRLIDSSHRRNAVCFVSSDGDNVQ
jgi:hypothetical protein